MRSLKMAVLALGLCAAACSPPAADDSASETVRLSENAKNQMARVNAARFTNPMSPVLRERPAQPEAGPAGADAKEARTAPGASFDAGLVRIQVLLDRAHFSPGVVDGFDGENVRKAVSEYQAANRIAVTGLADEALLVRLEAADAAPVLVSYVIAAADVSGPFVDVPEDDLQAMAGLDRLAYESAGEALAEKFHMDADLLRTLNPGADFSRPGTEIVVANAGGGLSGAVAAIEVDKGDGAVRALDADGNLLAFYPATIGSPEAPAPSGEHEVRAIAFDPTYRYDPERLPTFGERNHGALTIAAGPNNPVGAVWIALSLDTYGIHGAPEPALVSKTQSHGCVRLTNWDAIELARATQQGVPVRFVNRSSLEARRASGRG